MSRTPVIFVVLAALTCIHGCTSPSPAEGGRSSAAEARAEAATALAELTSPAELTCAEPEAPPPRPRVRHPPRIERCTE